MIELVFEIGCEELPAHFVEPALAQLDEAFREECDERRLEVKATRTVGTPRRLALLVEEMAEAQESETRTEKGPPKDVGLDGSGNWTPAAQSFAESHGATTDDLFVSDDDRIGVTAELSATPAREILPSILRRAVDALSFPKSMRWASYDERFGRPVRWIAAVADGEHIPLEFAGVESGTATRGHRFAAPEPIEIESIEEYVSSLSEAHVTVDPEDRRRRLVEMLDELAEEVGGRIVDDPELVDEVVHLIEEPHATRLDFDEAYLELPDEVLIESMRSHQRYFAIEDEGGGELLAHCGVIYNTPVRDPEVVNRGNLRVLRARLDDARFFWERDRERSLQQRLDDLESVVWLERIGSMRDRAERIGRMAGAIAPLLGFGSSTADEAARAGRLSKSDLVTEMVDEFPKLQGVMGRAYARADGESEPVARAIGEHYLPDGAAGSVPETDAGTAVALADKLGKLVDCFAIEMKPTSESDPYGLRRAALGSIRILDRGGFDVGFPELVETAVESTVEGEFPVEINTTKLQEELVSYLRRRLNFYLRADFPTEFVEAVLGARPEEQRASTVHEVRARLEALVEFRGDSAFEELVEGYKRVDNILGDRSVGTDAEVEPGDLEAPEAEALLEATSSTERAIDEAVDAGDWRAACDALVRLKGPIDEFFDNVRVNADNPTLRENRIALLATLRPLFLRVADISKL